tara:strand:+ start:1023 stop:1853 length:831 start_codon:yes stop_codon:yes gene_type:complete
MPKKILKIAKSILQVSIVAAIGFGISFGIYVSIAESLRAPSGAEMRALDHISHNLDSHEMRAVTRSRDSILQVLSGNEKRSGFAKMSGTYFTYDDKFFVLTAAHGVAGDCEYFFVATDDANVYDCLRYIIIEPFVDYAIIEIEEVSNRSPVSLNEVLPSNREWHQETAVFNEVFYTGYPNGLGPLSFRGEVAGISDKNYILLHSYAWPGSSGSGVFSYDGNMIGIIIALNVGFTGAGYDVLEDLVIVTPLFMIDWDAAYEIMNEGPPSGDTGDTGE